MRGKLLRHHMLSLSIDKGNTQQILAILSIFLRKTFFVKTNYIRNRKSFSKSFLPMNRKKNFCISFYNCPTSKNRITILNESHNYQTLPYYLKKWNAVSFYERSQNFHVRIYYRVGLVFSSGFVRRRISSFTDLLLVVIYKWGLRLFEGYLSPLFLFMNEKFCPERVFKTLKIYTPWRKH